MITAVIAGVGGLVVGAFMPAVGREIKSWFVKETTAAKTVVSGTVASSVVAAVKKL